MQFPALCELSVIDTAGVIGLDSLVNPGRPIEGAAHRGHLTDDMVAGACTSRQVLSDPLQSLMARRSPPTTVAPPTTPFWVRPAAWEWIPSTWRIPPVGGASLRPARTGSATPIT